MDCGRCCFAVFASSIISLALLITSMSVPYHIVVVTNPYARYVLGSGQLDSWSANRMGLDSDLLKELEENYVEFIRNLLPDIDYGDSEGREMKTGISLFTNVSNVDDWKKLNMVQTGNGSSTSDESVFSDFIKSMEMDVEKYLEDLPLQRTFALGLYEAKVCSISQTFKETCDTITLSKAFLLLNRELLFISQDISLHLWNDLRVEFLLSTMSCCLGILCLVVIYRPCCAKKQFPVYLGALSFGASGLMVFIPIIRIIMITSDFRQSLDRGLNITTKFGFFWSALAAGMSALFSISSAILLIARKRSKPKRPLQTLVEGDVEGEDGCPEGYTEMKTGVNKTETNTCTGRLGTSFYVDPRIEMIMK